MARLPASYLAAWCNDVCNSIAVAGVLADLERDVPYDDKFVYRDFLGPEGSCRSHWMISLDMDASLHDSEYLSEV